MRKYPFFALLLLGLMVRAQEAEERAVKQAIDDFFVAFHAQDSSGLLATVHPNVLVQSIATDSLGKAMVRTEGFQELVAHIIRIPDSIAFQEKLLDYTIQVDGPMAHAWTPYEFWRQGQFHHCGVNSFQLLKEGPSWKIIYLIDTRRKEGCP
jgi:hypothetical protein